MKADLELGNRKQLVVDGELDHDNELELSLDTDCDHTGHYVFLSLEDLKVLRDHLNILLEGKD